MQLNSGHCILVLFKVEGVSPLGKTKSEGKICTKTKHWCAVIADESSFSAQVSRSSMQNEPKLCKECRKNKKEAGRQYYTATCAMCGKEAKVPFMPHDDRPVYCSECYAKLKAEN